MQLTNAPGKLLLPFANSGAKNTIPTPSQIGITGGAASWTDGFPPLTRTPLAAGGVPPSGLDMNGVLFALSAIARWMAVGGEFPYDGTFAADSNIGGYPKGASVLRADGLGRWFNLVDNNTTNPDTGGSGWTPEYINGVQPITMTSSNVTLTASQYNRPIILITGTLTASLNLVFPSIPGEWIVINNTTGSFTITCKTAAGSGVEVSGAQKIVGEGVNIYGAGGSGGSASYGDDLIGIPMPCLLATVLPSINHMFVPTAPTQSLKADLPELWAKIALMGSGAETLYSNGTSLTSSDWFFVPYVAAGFPIVNSSSGNHASETAGQMPLHAHTYQRAEPGVSGSGDSSGGQIGSYSTQSTSNAGSGSNNMAAAMRMRLCMRFRKGA